MVVLRGPCGGCTLPANHPTSPPTPPEAGVRPAQALQVMAAAGQGLGRWGSRAFPGLYLWEAASGKLAVGEQGEVLRGAGVQPALGRGAAARASKPAVLDRLDGWLASCTARGAAGRGQRSRGWRAAELSGRSAWCSPRGAALQARWARAATLSRGKDRHAYGTWAAVHTGNGQLAARTKGGSHTLGARAARPSS